MPPVHSRSSPNPPDKEDALTKNNKAYPKVLAYFADRGLPPTTPLKKIELKSAKDKLKVAVNSSPSELSNATASASTFTKEDLQDYHWNFTVKENELSNSSHTVSSDKMIGTVPTTHSRAEVTKRLKSFVKAFRSRSSLLAIPPGWMTAPLTTDRISDILQAMLRAAVSQLPEDLVKEEKSLDETPYPEGHTSTFQWHADDPRSAPETFKRVLTVGPLKGIRSELIVERFYGSTIHGIFELKQCYTKANQNLPQALPLQVGASRPRPDIATIFVIEGLQDLYNPIISAAEAKIKAPREVDVQLAAALHPGLMLFALFHEKCVDHLKEAEKTGEVKSTIINLPDWFFLVGLTYDKDGIVFYVHTPRCYEVAGKQKWEFISFLLDATCAKSFTQGDFNTKKRVMLWTKLLMMMRHTSYVRDQLQKFLDVARGDAESYGAAFPDVFLELPRVFALEKGNPNEKKTNEEEVKITDEKKKEANEVKMKKILEAKKVKKVQAHAKKEVDRTKEEEEKSDLQQGGSEGTSQVVEPRRSGRKKLQNI